MTKLIRRPVHGVLDYSYVATVSAAPEMAGFADEKAAARLCRAMAGADLAYTLLTRAEWGLVPALSYQSHIGLDFASGIFALAAPWLLGFSANTRARNTFLAMGVTGVLVSLLSEPEEMPRQDTKTKDTEKLPMKINLKKIEDQVIVITGASSGIGLATARMAAQKGARLVLVSRNEDALKQLAAEITSGVNGSRSRDAIYVVADVGDESAVKEVGRRAIAHFGGWDTWVNDAGIGIFGRMLDGTTEDHRRLFETNFWGVVHGSLEAARHLESRGGAIINLGSTVSDRTVYLQAMYSSSKHAVKGFTDGLRMELEAEEAPVSVTLIQPGSIDTPFPQHARNYLDTEPTLPPPVYSPTAVAEAILHCAEHPTRSVFVGSGGKMLSAAEQIAPRLADKAMESKKFAQMQKTDQPPQNPQGALHAPTTGLRERGEYQGHVKETSLYTKASLHPVLTGALVLGATLGVVLLTENAAAQSRSPSGR